MALRAALAVAHVLAAAAARPASARPSMGFWPEYEGGRRVQLLDGEWRYGLHAVGEASFDSTSSALDVSRAELTPNATAVPSGMDVVPPGSMGPRGVAMYRRNFTQRRGPARVQFNACGFYCRVFVDGAEVGEHRAGGYVGFFLDVPSVERETVRELFVLADNRWNRTTAPLHTGGDFWHYGGLFRSVLLHDLPAAGAAPWPWRAYALPAADGYRQGVVDLTVMLTDPVYSGPVELNIAFDNGSSQALRAVAEHGAVELPGLRVPSPRLWSLQDPQLHTVHVLSAGGDGIVERFGLRWWGVDEPTSRLTLNGEVVKLHGWNHHTEWPGTGPSPTDGQLDGDLGLMRAAGCNYVRGAHYPQDQRWLDRLDEEGVAMWEEALGPGVKVADMQDWGHFMRFQLQQLSEMLDMSLNHASIMTWGWFNEGQSDDSRACPAYEACASLVRGRDPSRFTTWADNREDKSKCLDHASLIAFNSYPSWYSNSTPAEHWSRMATFVRSKYPGKPFVISETGAGAVYEWAHNSTDAKWTQRLQADIISQDVDVALNNSDISGVTLWHWSDFKANDKDTRNCGRCDYIPGVEPPTCGYINVDCNRPGGENHKGVVDFWRREKEAYHIASAKYNAFSASASDTGSSTQLAGIVI